MVRSTTALFLAAVLLLAASTPVIADGSTITVSTTQFNPAETNQGGTTNSAGTFNVSPLATSSSYQFQTLSQTSTFQAGSLATQSASGGGGGGSGGGSNGGGSTVVVTSTASTSTYYGGGSGGATSTGGSSGGGSSGVQTASNGLPSLSFEQNAAQSVRGEKGLWVAGMAVLGATIYGAMAIA